MRGFCCHQASRCEWRRSCRRRGWRALRQQSLYFRRLLEAAGKTHEAFRGDYCTVGDMARRDPDGFIHLVDRKSNMIITGGENVYPSDVESVISSHPSVHDVVVIGLPDDKWGERVHAVIVLREGAPRINPACTNGANRGWPATSVRARSLSCVTRRCPAR